MAYQNVGTPRFYINVFEWLSINGVLDVDSVFKMNPSNFKSYNNTDFSISRYTFNNNGFIAILGHTLSSDNHTSSLKSDGDSLSLSEIVNIGSDQHAIVPQYDGWSLATTDELDNKEKVSVYFTEPTGTDIGSIILGTYYDMPHSPDLNLTMTREYGGVKTIETRGGSTLTNSFYNGNPMWGDRAAWELTGGYAYDQEPNNFPSKLARSGRRIWDLSFSFLQDTDVLENVGALYWAEFESSGTPLSTDADYSDRTILNHNNFYSQVIHKTNGGQLPFIFQPDNTNNNPDQFAIAKLDMNSFQFNQTAFNKYTVKLKIREVW